MLEKFYKIDVHSISRDTMTARNIGPQSRSSSVYNLPMTWTVNSVVLGHEVRTSQVGIGNRPAVPVRALRCRDSGDVIPSSNRPSNVRTIEHRAIILVDPSWTMKRIPKRDAVRPHLRVIRELRKPHLTTNCQDWKRRRFTTHGRPTVPGPL